MEAAVNGGAVAGVQGGRARLVLAPEIKDFGFLVTLKQGGFAEVDQITRAPGLAVRLIWAQSALRSVSFIQSWASRRTKQSALAAGKPARCVVMDSWRT